MRDFLSAHAPLVVRLARREIAQRTSGAGAARVDAEDVAHDVLCALLSSERRGAFRPDDVDDDEAYLRKAVRRAVGHAGAASRRGPLLTSNGDLEGLSDAAPPSARAPSPEDLAVGRAEVVRRIEATKARLGPRDALVCAFLLEDELTIEETAAALGMTRNHVYQARFRIRRALASVLLDEEETP